MTRTPPRDAEMTATIYCDEQQTQTKNYITTLDIGTPKYTYSRQY